jgi:hypothetical protein
MRRDKVFAAVLAYGRDMRPPARRVLLQLASTTRTSELNLVSQGFRCDQNTVLWSYHARQAPRCYPCTVCLNPLVGLSGVACRSRLYASKG